MPCSVAHTTTSASAQTSSRGRSALSSSPAAVRGWARWSVLVYADVPPLGAALWGKQRTAVRVAVNEANHGACGCSNDIFRDVMRLLVGDVVFFRSSFSSHWVFFSNRHCSFRGYKLVPTLAAGSVMGLRCLSAMPFSSHPTKTSVFTTCRTR